MNLLTQIWQDYQYYRITTKAQEKYFSVFVSLIRKAVLSTKATVAELPKFKVTHSYAHACKKYGNSQAGDISQQQSTCLACARSCDPSSKREQNAWKRSFMLIPDINCSWRQNFYHWCFSVFFVIFFISLKCVTNTDLSRSVPIFT